MADGSWFNILFLYSYKYNYPSFIFMSELAKKWELFLIVDFSSDTAIVLAEQKSLGGHKTTVVILSA